MIYIGIDPGKKGAIAKIYDGDSRRGGYMREVEIEAIPIVTGDRDEYDLVSIAEFFRDLAPGHRAGGRGECFVVLEKPMPMPPRFKVAGGREISSSGLSQFHRGVQWGFAWMLQAFQLPHQLVHPRTWQGLMHAGTPGGDTKQRSILAAQRLFPGVDLRRSPRARKADDGFADALLLAEYARRTKNGGTRNG